MFYLDRTAAEEFYDVYKGVLPEYVPLIEHMISGPCIVLELRQQNVVNAFR
jgi:nucleoside-diphosphate kinase